MQAISVAIRCTTWTLKRNCKTNVSLVPRSGWHACIHTHMHVWAHPHLDAMKCSPATMEMLRLTRPPPLMSWFGSIRCTHAIARGRIHTCTSTWCGLLIKPLNKTAFRDSSSKQRETETNHKPNPKTEFFFFFFFLKDVKVFAQIWSPSSCAHTSCSKSKAVSTVNWRRDMKHYLTER